MSTRDAAADVLTGALLLGGAVFVIVEALSMPPRGPLGFVTGPGFLPAILGTALAVMSAVLFFGGLGRGGYQGMRPLVSTFASAESGRLAVIIALTGLLAVLIGRIPFWAANFIFFLLMFAYLRLGGGRPLSIVLFAAALTLFVAVLLPWAFELRMP